MKKFKEGDIVRSKENKFTRYKILKVNLFSIDVISIDMEFNYRYNGQSKELFYKESKNG